MMLMFILRPWTTIEYRVGRYTKLKIEISFFKGINETVDNYFALDNIQVGSHFPIPSWLGDNFLVLIENES